MKKFFWKGEKALSSFVEPALNIVKPALNIASSYIEMAVIAKTRNPKIRKATGKILKSISVGKVPSLTGLHGNGLRLKVMWFQFKSFILKRINWICVANMEIFPSVISTNVHPLKIILIHIVTNYVKFISRVGDKSKK